MRKQELKKRLKQSLHRMPVIVEGGHLEHTRLLAREAAYQRRSRERISFSCFLCRQIKFIGWKIWCVQGAFLGMLIWFFSGIYDFMTDPAHMAKLLLCSSVLVFMTAVPFLYRSIRYQMQEIEAAARFSSIKLLAAKLIAIGIGDFVMLCGIFLMLLVKTSLEAGSVALYLCVPFLLVCCGCLFMLGRLAPVHFLAGSIGYGSLFIGVAVMLPERYGRLFQQSFSAGWVVVCVLLVTFCAWQLHYILYDSPYTEMQLI